MNMESQTITATQDIDGMFISTVVHPRKKYPIPNSHH